MTERLADLVAGIAAWNLLTRRVEETAGGYPVDGVPLRFFHFSGFDPGRPYLLSGSSRRRIRC